MQQGARIKIMERLANLKKVVKRTTIYCVSSLFVSICATNTYAITSSADVKPSKQESVDLLYEKARKQESRKSYEKAINLYRQAAKKGHESAQIELANLYYHQKKNYKKAAFWYEKRAQEGHSDAQYHYANIFRFGLAGEKKYDIARYWYKRSANGGHKHAQFELAKMYKKGLGNKKSQVLANKWFTEAASNGHKEAKKVVRAYNKKAKIKTNNQNYIREQQKLAAQGVADAQFNLASAYFEGKIIPRNKKQALDWLTKAANNNHAAAQYKLAMIYYEGSEGFRKNLNKAKQWLVKAADNQSNEAEKKLNSLADQKYAEQQTETFDALLENAINGSAEDQYELGMRYLLGYKTSPDEKHAIRWIREAAQQGHALAQYQLGNYLLTHYSNTVELENAIEHLVLATKQNIKQSRAAVMKFYEFGFADLIDATYGDPDAQFRVAQNYLNQKNNKQKVLSVKWLELSAEAGHIPAIIALAELYELGDIVTKNLDQAFNLYLEAAKIDNSVAEFTLDDLLKQGIGSRENRQLALQIITNRSSISSTDLENNLQFSELK